MHRSVVASLTNRPVTRFASSESRPTSRRLGLGPIGVFTASSASTTVLRRADLGPIVGRRTGWPIAVPAGTPTAGSPRPSVAIHWAHSARARAVRRSSAAATPWRG